MGARSNAADPADQSLKKRLKTDVIGPRAHHPRACALTNPDRIFGEGGAMGGGEKKKALVRRKQPASCRVIGYKKRPQDPPRPPLLLMLAACRTT